MRVSLCDYYLVYCTRQCMNKDLLSVYYTRLCELLGQAMKKLEEKLKGLRSDLVIAQHYYHAAFDAWEMVHQIV